jgi:hypothetical protein
MNLYIAIILSLGSSNYQTRLKSERALIDMPFLEPELRRHMETTLEVKLRSEKILRIWEDREIESLTANAPKLGVWYWAEIESIKAPLTGKELRNFSILVRVHSIDGRQAHVQYSITNQGPEWTPIDWTKWKWHKYFIEGSQP